MLGHSKFSQRVLVRFSEQERVIRIGNIMAALNIEFSQRTMPLESKEKNVVLLLNLD